MNTGEHVESRFVHALRTQGKAEHSLAGAFPCPYPEHQGTVFQNVHQLFDHAKADHAAQIEGLDPRVARAQLKDASLKIKIR